MFVDFGFYFLYVGEFLVVFRQLSIMTVYPHGWCTFFMMITSDICGFWGLKHLLFDVGSRAPLPMGSWGHQVRRAQVSRQQPIRRERRWKPRCFFEFSEGDFMVSYWGFDGILMGFDGIWWDFNGILNFNGIWWFNGILNFNGIWWFNGILIEFQWNFNRIEHSPLWISGSMDQYLVIWTVSYRRRDDDLLIVMGSMAHGWVKSFGSS